MPPRWRNVILLWAALPITPERRMSSAVSSNAFVSRLGFFLVVIAQLLQCPVGKGCRDLTRYGVEPGAADLAKGPQFVRLYIVAFVLGEPIKEDRPVAATV